MDKLSPFGRDAITISASGLTSVLLAGFASECAALAGDGGFIAGAGFIGTAIFAAASFVCLCIACTGMCKVAARIAREWA
jgi:hypothetical protein